MFYKPCQCKCLMQTTNAIARLDWAGFPANRSCVQQNKQSKQKKHLVTSTISPFPTLSKASNMLK